MKLAQSLALIITGSASFVIPFALAQFHITKFDDSIYGQTSILACSSKTYGCDCFSSAAKVMVEGEEAKSLPDTAFYIESGLCGSASSYVFFLQSDGRWNFYVVDGNGVLQHPSQGTCYPNTATPTTCSGLHAYTKVYDQLVCYSDYICKA